VLAKNGIVSIWDDDTIPFLTSALLDKLLMRIQFRLMTCLKISQLQLYQKHHP